MKAKRARASKQAPIGEARLSTKAAASIRSTIRLHGGNEVCFVCGVDEEGTIISARKVAAGDVQSVLALPGCAERGELLLHNHPSGELTPSDADMEVAYRFHGNGVGFGIVDNDATRVYIVAEVPKGKVLTTVDPDVVDVTLGPYGLVAQAMRQLHGARDYEDRPAQRAMDAANAQAGIGHDDDRADLVHPARRVDDSRMGENRDAHASPSRLRRVSSSASITAIRTATPISTCSWITLCGPSAISDAISTPRFIGPGCMTSASCFAAFSFSASRPK